MCHLCWGEDRDELYDDGVDDYERDYDHWQFRQPYTIDRKNARMGKSPILVVSSKSITKPDSAYAQDSRPWKQAVVPKFEDNKNYLPEARRGSLKMPSAGEQLSMLASVDRKAAIRIPSPMQGTFNTMLHGAVYLRLHFQELDCTILDYDTVVKGKGTHCMGWCRYGAFSKSGRLLKGAAAKGPEPILDDAEFKRRWDEEHTVNTANNPFSKLPTEIRAEIYALTVSTGHTFVAATQEQLTEIQCVSRYMYEDVSAWAYHKHWLLFSHPSELLDFMKHVAQSPKLKKGVEFGKITIQVYPETRKYNSSSYVRLNVNDQWVGYPGASFEEWTTSTHMDWAFAMQELLKTHTVDTLELKQAPYWIAPYWTAPTPFIQSLLQFRGKERVNHLILSGNTQAQKDDRDLDLVGELKQALEKEPRIRSTADTLVVNKQTGNSTFVKQTSPRSITNPPRKRKATEIEPESEAEKQGHSKTRKIQPGMIKAKESEYEREKHLSEQPNRRSTRHMLQQDTPGLVERKARRDAMFENFNMESADIDLDLWRVEMPS